MCKICSFVISVLAAIHVIIINISKSEKVPPISFINFFLNLYLGTVSAVKKAAAYC